VPGEDGSYVENGLTKTRSIKKSFLAPKIGAKK
jgi:hypothetical protein